GTTSGWRRSSATGTSSRISPACTARCCASRASTTATAPWPSSTPSMPASRGPSSGSCSSGAGTPRTSTSRRPRSTPPPGSCASERDLLAARPRQNRSELAAARSDLLLDLALDGAGELVGAVQVQVEAVVLAHELGLAVVVDDVVGVAAARALEHRPNVHEAD